MKYLYLISIALFLVICGCEKETSIENEASNHSSEFSTSHNAQNSLDWAGSYSGTLPCASCPGIETTISLSDDGSYQMEMIYLGDGESSAIESNGTFSWNEAGNTITLQKEDKPNQYFVGENTLTKLDMEGNRISGELADLYVLKKE